MALSKAARDELDRFNDELRHLGRSSHHTPLEYPKAVRLFMRMLDEGERVHPDDVREWARSHGWSTEHARDLGAMAEVVEHVYREMGRLTP